MHDEHARNIMTMELLQCDHLERKLKLALHTQCQSLGLVNYQWFFRSCIGWELSSGSSSSSQYSSSAAWTAWLRRTYPATYYVCQTWRLVNACVPRQRRRSSSRRHAFLPLVTALSPWLRRGIETACRDLSHRYLHWRPLDVSWRPELFSRSFPDLDSSARDRIWQILCSHFALHSRFVTVFSVCMVSLHSFDITPPFLSIIIISILVCRHIAC